MSAAHDDDDDDVGYDTEPPSHYTEHRANLTREYNQIIELIMDALRQMSPRDDPLRGQARVTGMSTKLTYSPSNFWMDLLRLFIRAQELSLRLNDPTNERINKLSNLLGKIINETFENLPAENMYGKYPSLLSPEMREDISSSYYRLYSEEPKGYLIIDRDGNIRSRREEELRDIEQQRDGMALWINGRWIAIMKMFIRLLGWNDVAVSLLTTKGNAEILDALRNPLMRRILVFARLVYRNGELPFDTDRGLGTYWADPELTGHLICLLISRPDASSPWGITVFDSSAVYHTWLRHGPDNYGNREAFFERFVSTVERGRFNDASLPEKKRYQTMDIFESAFSRSTWRSLIQYIKDINHSLELRLDYPELDHQGTDPYRCGIFATYYMFYYVLLERTSFLDRTTGEVMVYPPNIDPDLFGRFIARVIRIFHGANLQGLGQFKHKKLKGGAISDDINSEYEKMLNVFIKWVESFIHDKE